jgi:hypothetical protein
MPPWDPRELANVGTPTTAHKARIKLYLYLWSRTREEPTDEQQSNVRSGAT